MREKLIELCEDLETLPCCDTHEAQADYLIANGVTIPVYCKECKGWCTEEIAKHYGVERYCTMTMMPTNADDFCSYGERRTDV